MLSCGFQTVGVFGIWLLESFAGLNVALGKNITLLRSLVDPGVFERSHAGRCLESP